MNLHGIASGIISAVNPRLTVSLSISTGSVTQTNGERTPTYAAARLVPAQVQPMSFKDLQQIEGLNISGVRWKVYLYGKVDGIVRPERKGGDKIVISQGPHSGTWLVVQVLEQWPDWVAAAITLQNSS